MAKGKKKTVNNAPRILNRRARHDYDISETLECGIQLKGSEVKSIRNGKVQLSEGYATLDNKGGALYLLNVDIAAYDHAGPTTNHPPRRQRKLLAHKREIKKLIGITSTKGTTLIPLAMYFVRGRVKVEIGVATGKKQHDKREDIKKKESEREIRRAMSKRI